ncbi:hypothetical protein RUND412_003413 [Rhizina undulata]
MLDSKAPRYQINKILIDGGAIALGVSITTATSQVHKINYFVTIDVEIAGVSAAIRYCCIPGEKRPSYELLLSRQWLKQCRAVGKYTEGTYTIFDRSGKKHEVPATPVNANTMRREVPQVNVKEAEEDVTTDEADTSADDVHQVVRQVITETIEIKNLDNTDESSTGIDDEAEDYSNTAENYSNTTKEEIGKCLPVLVEEPTSTREPEEKAPKETFVEADKDREEEIFFNTVISIETETFFDATESIEGCAIIEDEDGNRTAFKCEELGDWIETLVKLKKMRVLKEPDIEEIKVVTIEETTNNELGIINNLERNVQIDPNDNNEQVLDKTKTGICGTDSCEIQTSPIEDKITEVCNTANCEIEIIEDQCDIQTRSNEKKEIVKDCETDQREIQLHPVDREKKKGVVKPMIGKDQK